MLTRMFSSYQQQPVKVEKITLLKFHLKIYTLYETKHFYIFISFIDNLFYKKDKKYVKNQNTTKKTIFNNNLPLTVDVDCSAILI